MNIVLDQASAAMIESEEHANRFVSSFASMVGLGSQDDIQTTRSGARLSPDPTCNPWIPELHAPAGTAYDWSPEPEVRILAPQTSSTKFRQYARPSTPPPSDSHDPDVADHAEFLDEVSRLKASIASREQLLHNMRLEYEKGKAGMKGSVGAHTNEQRNAAIERAKWMANRCQDDKMWEQDIELFVDHRDPDRGLMKADRNLGAGLRHIAQLEKERGAAGKASKPMEHLLELNMHAEELEEEIRQDREVLKIAIAQACRGEGASVAAQEFSVNQGSRAARFSSSLGNLAVHGGSQGILRDQGECNAHHHKDSSFAQSRSHHHMVSHHHENSRHHLVSPKFSSSESKIAHWKAQIKAQRNIQKICDRITRLEESHMSRPDPVVKDQSLDVHKHVRTLQGGWHAEVGPDDHRHHGKHS